MVQPQETHRPPLRTVVESCVSVTGAAYTGKDESGANTTGGATGPRPSEDTRTSLHTPIQLDGRSTGRITGTHCAGDYEMTPVKKGNLARGWAAVAALGIVSVTAVEMYALSQGINGTALTASLAAIAGLGGTGVGRLLK